MAYLAQVIIAETRRGRGTEEDVCRCVTQIWTTDGKLIAEIDPLDRRRPIDLPQPLRQTTKDRQ